MPESIMRCAAGLAALALVVGVGCTRSAPRWNVVLVTLDTTRADHLGCYGYGKQTSRRIDALARQGVRFENAMAQATVTPVSHASILTGLEPYTHGLRVMHRRVGSRLAETHTTLAEVLRARGYHTAAFVSAFPVSEYFGLHQGYEVFDAAFLQQPVERIVTTRGMVNTDRNQRRAGDTTDRALAWLAQVEAPFHLWVHYFDPHDDRMLPPVDVMAGHDLPERDLRARLRAIYDIEIAYMDRELGRVLDALREAGQLDRTIVVVTADHGEGLGDHGWWTHGILYREQMRVPLILRGPGIPAGVSVEPLVRTIDIVPTILELIGATGGDVPAADGASLVPLLTGAGSSPGHAAYADSINTLTYQLRPTIVDRKDDVLLALLDGRWKYIHHVLKSAQSELYDLERDPGELSNVHDARPDVVADMRRRLLARGCLPGPQLADHGMSEEDLARLRSLGYLAD